MSKRHDDFYRLDCRHLFATGKNVNLIKKYVEIKTLVTL